MRTSIKYANGSTHDCENLADATASVRADYKQANVGPIEYAGQISDGHVLRRNVYRMARRGSEVIAEILQVCTCADGQHAIDAAVRLMSGWATWIEMRDNLRVCNNSYAPTLRDDDNVAPEQRHKDAIRLMRQACDAEKFRWYDGDNLHNDLSVPRRRARPQRQDVQS